MTVKIENFASRGFACYLHGFLVVVCVYRHSNFRGWLRKITYCVIEYVRKSCSGSPKVVDFGTNLKSVLLLIHIID